MQQLNEQVFLSHEAFAIYRHLPLSTRAALMRAIAVHISGNAGSLIQTAMHETNLGAARLQTELNRTVFQLNRYASACENGQWLDARIDTAHAGAPDIRKTMVPLGPVLVFGASNFPFAYSTAGGDTACALAAGCSVIVKAHPAHPATSEQVAACIQQALQETAVHKNVFIHISDSSPEAGEALVKHPLIKAVGFTGSYQGGRQIFDWGQQRPEPIPVFAEMGSINPVFLLPDYLQEHTHDAAAMFAHSITLSAGQFCTNPGLLIGIRSKALEIFCEQLGSLLSQTAPMPMLHSGIAANYHKKKNRAAQQTGIQVVATGMAGSSKDEADTMLAKTTAATFLSNPLLHEEVFGPYSLLVVCTNEHECMQVANSLAGQLTCTLMGTENDMASFSSLKDTLAQRCGRLLFNAVPTGVTVALSMQHGGPFPASTDSRFTAVGADGIRRFARPLAFQNWPNHLLPIELTNENPLHIWRTVNNELTKNAIV